MKLPWFVWLVLGILTLEMCLLKNDGAKPIACWGASQYGWQGKEIPVGKVVYDGKGGCEFDTAGKGHFICVRCTND